MELLRTTLLIVAPLLIAIGILLVTVAWLKPALLQSEWLRPRFSVPDRMLRKLHVVQGLQAALTGTWILLSLSGFFVPFVIAVIAGVASSIWLIALNRQARAGAQT